MASQEFINPILMSLHNLNKSVQSEDQLILELNNLLSSNKTRMLGLQFLQKFIPYCSTTNLSKYINHWTNLSVVQNATDPRREIKLNTLAIILESSKNLDPFSKHFSEIHLNPTVKTCMLPGSTTEQVASLKCLIQCMKKFPVWFGKNVQSTESFLFQYLDTPHELLAGLAAEAFMCYLQTGLAGISGKNHITNFATHFTKICLAIKSFQRSLFPDEFNVPEQSYSYEQFKNVQDQDKVALRLINSLKFLKMLLAKRFPVEKRLVPHEVVDIICKGLSLHICVSKTNEQTKLCLLLKKIQISLLDVLVIYIKGFHRDLLPFCFVIEHCLVNAFRRMSTCNCFDYDLPYKKSIHKAINTWLNFIPILDETYVQEKLMPELLKKINPGTSSILLNIKANKELEVKNDDMTGLIASQNCSNALETLKYLIDKSLTFDQDLLTELITFLVSTCSLIQCGKMNKLYEDSKCQMKLYELLLSISQLENENNLPPLHIPITLFNRSLVDSKWKLVQVSDQSLAVLEKICQPRCPTLNIATSSSIMLTQEVVEEESINVLIDAQSDNEYQLMNDDVVNVSDDSQQKIESEEVSTVEVNADEDRIESEEKQQEVNAEEEMDVETSSTVEQALKEKIDVEVGSLTEPLSTLDDSVGVMSFAFQDEVQD